jgi:hypothetical protein
MIELWHARKGHDAMKLFENGQSVRDAKFINKY